MSDQRTCRETGDPIEMVCVLMGSRHTHYPPVAHGDCTVALEDIEDE